MKNFVLVFGGLGVILLGIAAWLYVDEVKFLERAEPATGTVADLMLTGDGDGGSSYCPKINFTTRAGQRVAYYGNVCSNPPEYDIGDPVEVYYDPDDIRQVQMKGFWPEYAGIFVLSAIGLPFLALGLFGLYIGRGKPAQTGT